MGLTAEQKNQFFETGYLIIPHFFKIDELDDIKGCIQGAIDKIHRKKLFLPFFAKEDQPIEMQGEVKVDFEGTQVVFDEKSGAIKRLVWIGAMEKKLLHYGRSNKITEIVAQLLDSSEADHLICQVHPKIPKDGVVYNWHQDVYNRKKFDKNWEKFAKNSGGSFVQTLLAVDEHTSDNGTLVVIPKSHHLGYLEGFPNFATEDKIDAYFLTLQADMGKKGIIDKHNIDLSQKKCLSMDANSLLLMHPSLLHSSGPNQSVASRFTFINGYAYPGANITPYPGKGSSERIRLTPNECGTDLDTISGEQGTSSGKEARPAFF